MVVGLRCEARQSTYMLRSHVQVQNGMVKMSVCLFVINFVLVRNFNTVCSNYRHD